MRELKIAYGNSRTAKTWSNKGITFEDLCERLKTPLRTAETTAEYKKLPKKQREEIKDKGGFVAGHLKSGLRKIESVECRSMLVFDLDEISEAVKEKVKEIKYAGCIYSTHSHTPSAPRLRIILPVTEDMNAEDFNAVARFVARELGILEAVDVCSFKPNQLMYWPTCPSDGEYVFKVIEGEWINPKKVLADHPNYRDISLLPTTPKESKAQNFKSKKQEDPLEKKGIVGVFCRCYSITAVMDKFLSGIYAPSVIEGRYDYLPGEGVAGVVVYDDKWVYSHHATDPACGHLLNAFDLVRVHKFGNDEDSFKQMSAFATEQSEVRVALVKEKSGEAKEDFENDDDWMASLEYQKGGKALANTVDNLLLILEHDPSYQNFAFNELACRVEVTGAMPWKRPKDNRFWRDADTAQLKADLDGRYGVFSTRNHDVAFSKVSDDRAFHPIRDYLNSLPVWDGVPRLEMLFIDYFGAEDTAYVRAVSRKSLVAAVARVYRPGIKFDNVPILNGPQGIGKSTFFSRLAGKWFSDSLTLTDMKDKSGAEKLQGYWILELGELSGMRKADVETVKGFISRQDDQYRPSYGHTVESHPRQCIVVGTTNAESGFLRDITGNRRFWPIKATGESRKKAWELNKEEVEQIWAEAKKYFDEGEKLYLDKAIVKQAEDAQMDAMEKDERKGAVEVYLNTLLPSNWDDMDLYERRNFLSEDIGAKGTEERTEVSNAEIWAECLGRNIADLKPSDSYAISALMAQIEGWERSKRIKKQKIYGKQRVYIRKATSATRNSEEV